MLHEYLALSIAKKNIKYITLRSRRKRLLTHALSKSSSIELDVTKKRRRWQSRRSRRRKKISRKFDKHIRLSKSYRNIPQFRRFKHFRYTRKLAKRKVLFIKPMFPRSLILPHFRFYKYGSKLTSSSLKTQVRLLYRTSIRLKKSHNRNALSLHLQRRRRLKWRKKYRFAFRLKFFRTRFLLRKRRRGKRFFRNKLSRKYRLRFMLVRKSRPINLKLYVLRSRKRKLRLRSYLRRLSKKSSQVHYSRKINRNNKPRYAKPRVSTLLASLKPQLAPILAPFYYVTHQLDNYKVSWERRSTRKALLARRRTLSIRRFRRAKFRRFKSKQRRFRAGKIRTLRHLSITKLKRYAWLGCTAPANSLGLSKAQFIELPTQSIRSLSGTNVPVQSLQSYNAFTQFTIRFVSLFLNFRISVNNLSYRLDKFIVKKALFSFLRPNESRRLILFRRRRIRSSRILKNLASKTHSFSKPYNSRFTNFLLTHTYKVSQRQSTLWSNYKSNKPHQGYKRVSRELLLPRVKFKPGYQRIWRRARLAVAENLRVRYVYQQQLTKLTMRLSRKSTSYSFAMSETSLDKAIVYSRLLPDVKTINEFIHHKLISLNGWNIVNLSEFVIPGDFIQVSISNNMYIYFKWLFLWASISTRKFKKLVYRKGRASQYKVMKKKKQRSQHVPYWIYNSRFVVSDIKPSFEVDYFTLSSFVLYDPLLIDYYTPDDFPDHRHYIYRLYNWKYIT